MLKKIFPPLFLLLLWQIIATEVFSHAFYFPPVIPILQQIFEIYTKEDGLWHTLATIERVLIGFTLATMMGISIGLFLGTYKKLFSALEIFIEFFRSLPATALYPLFLLFFGIGDASKIAIITFISFWIILIHTLSGIWNASKVRKEVGTVFNLTQVQIFYLITLPDALPSLFVGLRTALSLSLIAGIVSEMFIGTEFGLGQKIFDSYMEFRIDQLYAYIFITGIIGYSLNKIFIQLEKKIVHWTT